MKEYKTETPKQHQFAVGDKLAFRHGGFPHYWTIAKIESITPSGRIKIGRWILNPDLSIRGDTHHYGPRLGQPVTDRIRQEMVRHKNLMILLDVNFDKLTDKQLAMMVDIACPE